MGPICPPLTPTTCDSQTARCYGSRTTTWRTFRTTKPLTHSLHRLPSASPTPPCNHRPLRPSPYCHTPLDMQGTRQSRQAKTEMLNQSYRRSEDAGPSLPGRQHPPSDVTPPHPFTSPSPPSLSRFLGRGGAPPRSRNYVGPFPPPPTASVSTVEPHSTFDSRQTAFQPRLAARTGTAEMSARMTETAHDPSRQHLLPNCAPSTFDIPETHQGERPNGLLWTSNNRDKSTAVRRVPLMPVQGRPNDPYESGFTAASGVYANNTSFEMTQRQRAHPGGIDLTIPTVTPVDMFQTTSPGSTQPNTPRIVVNELTPLKTIPILNFDDDCDGPDSIKLVAPLRDVNQIFGGTTNTDRNYQPGLGPDITEESSTAVADNVTEASPPPVICLTMYL